MRRIFFCLALVVFYLTAITTARAQEICREGVRTYDSFTFMGLKFIAVYECINGEKVLTHMGLETSEPPIAEPPIFPETEEPPLADPPIILPPETKEPPLAKEPAATLRVLEKIVEAIR